MVTVVRDRITLVTGWAGARKAAWRQRAANWVRKRQGEDRLPLTIGTRRVYILPTRGGLAFASLLFVMLLAGINYSNSTAMIVTFLLAGFALIAMHLTHRNLLGVVAKGLATGEGFAGEHALLMLTLESSGNARFGIDCETAAGESVTVHLRETGAVRADIPVLLGKRGRVPVGRIKLSTSFPFGLFRAWTYLHVQASLLAWPIPRGKREPPAESATGGDAPAVHRAGDEEWAGLREFRSGDSPRQVAWRAFARGRGLLVKTYQSPAAHFRSFDLATLPGPLEARLEQLSAWIVGAHARGERYGLTAAPLEIPPDSGNDHRRRCLDALAVYGDPGEDTHAHR